MIRMTVRCPKGHSYESVKPSLYAGKAQYPPACPHCRR